jgi:hypothetical protein
MVWAVPTYTRGEVDRAGCTLVDSSASFEALDAALTVINNWRSSHAFPLNTFQVGLRTKARQVDENALVAQRIKRLSSIEYKLERFPTMNMSQMQDIGGCRAVVSNVAHVRALLEVYQKSSLKHKLMRIDHYIDHPQVSGYRGVHLIYRYFSDRKTTYNGLQIEIQLRSQLQHAWATAVETVQDEFIPANLVVDKEMYATFLASQQPVRCYRSYRAIELTIARLTAWRKARVSRK